LLPPHVKKDVNLPYLGPLLDAGIAAIFAEEIVEAIRYVEEPDFYQPSLEDPDIDNGKIWLGAADDAIMRKRGVEFVDGTAPGFAAIVGAAPTPEIAKNIVEEYQKKNLYIFLAANQNGTTVTQQLLDANVQIGWNTRIVPFGPEIPAAVYALGFANRAGLSLKDVLNDEEKQFLDELFPAGRKNWGVNAYKFPEKSGQTALVGKNIDFTT
jgi:acetyl-CoA synthase